MHRILLTVCLAFLLGTPLHAQIPRERVSQNGPVEATFWAPNVILTSSVHNLPQGNLNVTIMHSFGIVTSGPDNLFGLDDAANIRFGVDYGLLNRLSVGVGRSRFDKLYDFRVKANVLRQTTDDHIPLEVTLKGDLGITTQKNGYHLIDRLSYFTSIMVARKFSERLSLQLTPMYSHFNTVAIERGSGGRILEEENGHLAVGLVGRFVLSRRLALLVEYLPVLGSRSDGTADAFSLGLNIDTGGHVFQLFLTTSQWLTEQHVIARNTDTFFAGDFRVGFNVNRIFGTGGD